MPLIPLGKFTVTPGTPIRITSGQPLPAQKFGVHGVMVQALFNNTGKIYVGNSTLDKAAMVGVHATLAVPTANTIPSFTAALTAAPNSVDLAQIYIDGDVQGEGVTVSYLQA